MSRQNCDNSRPLSKSHFTHYCAAVMRILTVLPLRCGKVPRETRKCCFLREWMHFPQLSHRRHWLTFSSHFTHVHIVKRLLYCYLHIKYILSKVSASCFGFKSESTFECFAVVKHDACLKCHCGWQVGKGAICGSEVCNMFQCSGRWNWNNVTYVKFTSLLEVKHLALPTKSVLSV